MAAPTTCPISSPMHYDPSFKGEIMTREGTLIELLLKNAVDVQLHQPLLSSSTTPDDVRLEMMSLCFQLETLCKKELTENSSIHQGHVSNSFIDRATVVYDRILHLLAKVPPDYQDCLRYLQSQRLDRLYPRAVTYLANPRSFSLDLDKTPLDSYFASVSTLSQLTTLARQMHNDCVNTSSHKYIAHQLALMYQTITQIKSPLFEQHKKGIEEMFKPIKATLATTDDKQIRCLTQSQQEWLLDLTNHILNTVNTFPADLTQDMVQPASVLQQKST